MYTEPHFPTKKALKEAVKAGREVMVYQPGPFPGKENGEVSVEGAYHVGGPHRWYARVKVEGGRIVKVIG